MSRKTQSAQKPLGSRRHLLASVPLPESTVAQALSSVLA